MLDIIIILGGYHHFISLKKGLYMKILLVEDEELLSNAIVKGLRKYNYAVDCAYDGEEALELYHINQYDLMILDLNLPKIDGLEVLARIREHDSALRVLILSARSSIADKVAGLDSGSNDYLSKPFDFFELEARIRALLRQEVILKNVELSSGSLKLNTASRLVYWNNNQIDLTKKEFSILEYLMTHMDKIISAEELIEHVWDSDTNLFSNSFRFHISSLRKKLAAVSGDDNLIITIRNQGYSMAKGVADK